jgi:hypothetical protein
LVIEKVIVLRLKADIYRYLCEFTDGFYNKECRESALITYQQASGESCRFSPANPLVMKVALSHSIYYYEVLNSIEFAMRLLGEALFEAKEEYAGYKRKASEEEIKDYHETHKTIEINL